ncbi:MACPF domain-containing protein At1g14780-like isoform X2 [Triticum urartu]|uniref:MACPF domain-containing protein At1g14780-like isoform X2 n=1 Tax=Triticum dicoccoides TaxID=85692 RepID=UPI001891668D|nr:MACPF domain-containing protein At1g14780-like isoform X2 [Triticum dicoccoides]XP_044402948.1 MACPF domain-containing protein At1g14780-like isoform X2 [Triticum aestivum]XP_048533711.1 MACPF domain-containing protein At1g14780-like isoform X2 [Triticum urartu]XP_048533712.1 MACPF domain-containing protein At1g14780-like isoform X2 [Triticum urartu]
MSIGRYPRHRHRRPKMSELLNQKSSVQGKVPSGYFNALFDLMGAWLTDAKEIKYLAFDGYFISLFNLNLKASPLVLCDEVKKAVPSKWDPVALSWFIRTYGTHIIVEMAVGGQDVICVKQSHSSTISSAELKLHLEDLGDFLFSDGKNLSPIHRKTKDGKSKVPDVFVRIVQQPNNLHLSSYSESSTKDGLTITCSKRGGDVHIPSHSKWLPTVPKNPDAIMFKFVPITSLLTGIPGSGYLSHAINLYLRYKPDLDDLQHFLEFQVPLQWAPVFNVLVLGPQKRKGSYPSLQFRFLGPKLRVNTSQVSSAQKPVVGLRLYLEGRKCNQLAIHVQHLSSVPSMLGDSMASSMSEWRESEDTDPGYIEAIQWNSYSCISTSVVKYNPEWSKRVSGGVFIVTGAQLFTKGTWARKVLHLRLLYTHIPKCTIHKSEWTRAPAASQKGSFFTTISTTLSSPFMHRNAQPAQKHEPAQLNSGVYPDGPPVPLQSRKLLKFVDMSEVVKGAHDVPGHWLVTAAKLVKEAGKIGLHVKFALLNYDDTEQPHGSIMSYHCK